MPPTIKIKIGDITTAVDCISEPFNFDTPRPYQPFVCSDQTDIHLDLVADFPELELGAKHFSSPPIWTLYRNGKASFIHIYDQYPELQRLLVMPSKFKRAELYFAESGGRFIDPFFGPTMELLMINYLAQGHGVIIHACGIDYNGQGMLLAGESGAGKSTLANLWNRESGVLILSDDRTLVRQIDGELWMFGTPWHGESKFGSPRGVKLKKIFFLRHSQKNEVKALSVNQSMLRLLQCSFPTYWDAAGMEYTMKFFEELVSRVPSHELSFVPDQRVIEYLKEKG